MIASINTVVTLFITCESSSSERRMDKIMNIGTIKERLSPITGVPVSSMKLSLYSDARVKNDQFLCSLDDDTRILGSYNVDDFMRIHVTDTNTTRQKGEFTDVSLVEKFEMKQDDYNKRTDSVRAFKMRNKMGRFADQDEAELERRANEFSEEAKNIHIGDRCMIEVSEEGLKKRGTVMYVGLVDFKPGHWVGVKYDEPLGKHNGSVQGKMYFSCPPKYGAFIRPNKLQIGDYPEEDIFEDLDEM